jgi:protein CWC15
MTTAHRPTWKAAVGKANEGGWGAGGATSAALSSLDLPAHTKLKFRTGKQVVDRQKALKESLKKLEAAEQEANKRLLQRPAVDEKIEEEGRMKLLKQTAEVDEVAIRGKYDDEDASDGDDGGGWSDVENDDLDASSDDDDDDEDDDDEDDEAALQAELAKIRAEREALKRKEEEEQAAKDEEKLEEAALIGNPLLAGSNEASSGRLKRRWNEDVVFRNQAKGEPEIKKRFINDTVRNDFHKRFLNKFIR